MAVRTATLGIRSSAAANSEHTVYTVPSGKTAIVKDIRMYSEAGCTRAVVFVNRSGPGSVSLVDQALGATSIHSEQGFIVLEPADELRVYSEGGTFVTWVSGAELAGVAP